MAERRRGVAVGYRLSIAYEGEDRERDLDGANVDGSLDDAREARLSSIDPSRGSVLLRFLADHRSPGGVLTRREWLRVGGLAGLGLLAGPRAPAAALSRPFPGFGKAEASTCATLRITEKYYAKLEQRLSEGRAKKLKGAAPGFAVEMHEQLPSPRTSSSADLRFLGRTIRAVPSRPHFLQMPHTIAAFSPVLR